MAFGESSVPSAGGKATLKPILKNTGQGQATGTSASSTPQQTGASNVWASGRTNALKSALADKRNPTQGPRPKSVMMAFPVTPSDIAGNMGKLDINGTSSGSWRASAGAYNPSVGPTPSAMTTKWRQTNAPSRVTARSTRHAFQNSVYKISNYTRRDFKLGDVIAAPFHVANTNPDVDPNDDRLTITREGPAYSKRRMMVVIFMHQHDLFCLPLYSFSGRGLKEKAQHLKEEYVSMKNVGTEGFVNYGVHPPAEIMAHRPLTDSTTVHLAGGLRVGCNEDITMVGRLTERSHFRLVEIWKNLTGQAQGERW